MFGKIDEEAAAKAKAFDAKLISELTVAEFKALMIGIIDSTAHRKEMKDMVRKEQLRNIYGQQRCGGAIANGDDWTSY